MTIRYKRPDHKNALSLLNAAALNMKFTLTIPVSEQAGVTIVRNIYESFRMLGDALLLTKGIEADDHVAPLKELLTLRVDTTRPISLLDNLRRLRHNVNYYGYIPNVAEVDDIVSIAKSCFEPLHLAVLEKVSQ